MNRRGFLTGLGALIAAPAIVNATNIMPVKSIKPGLFLNGTPIFFDEVPQVGGYLLDYNELEKITRDAFCPLVSVQAYTQSPLLSFIAQLQAESPA